MHKELRNFNCPETEKACSDGRCTKERCFERARLEVAEKSEAIAKQQRITSAEVWESIAPFFREKN